jgi:hypothetical protein
LTRQRGSVTFRSYDGKAFRMDSDTELTFFPDHSVHMLEWGFTLNHYRGAYHAHSDGCVVARFKGFDQEWPVMVAYREGDVWMLRPWDPDVRFATGTRGGATVPAGGPTYWPFRMLTGEEEKKVLGMIREYANPPIPHAPESDE